MLFLELAKISFCRALCIDLNGSGRASSERLLILHPNVSLGETVINT